MQIAGKMSRPSVNPVVIDVAKDRHAAELVLVMARGAALRHELVGIAAGAEQAIPDRQVGEIVSVHVALVMH